MPKPNLSLKEAIKDEQSKGVNPDLVKNQLQIIAKAKPIGKKHIEDFLHGKDIPGLKMSDLNAYQELAVYRMNNNLRLFPYNMNVKKNKIYPLY